MAIPLEQLSDRRSLRTKSDVWLGVLLGAWGLFSVYRGVVLFFDPSSSHTARALPMGVLLLLIAAQCFTGASRDARLWLVSGLFLIPFADVVLAVTQRAGQARSWSEVVLLAGPVLIAALLALWIVIRQRRSERKGA